MLITPRRSARPLRTMLAGLTLLVGVSACGGGGTDTPVAPVTPPAPVAGVLAKLAVNATETQLELGQGTVATAEGRDGLGGAVALGTRTVTWTSSNAAIATVKSTGLIAAVGVGSATITATVPNGTGTASGSVALVITGIAGAPATADVAMATQLFIPSEIVVKIGGTVRFFFTNIEHNVIWNPRLTGSPTDILVTTSQTITRVFPTVGVYPFDCTVHPGMSGRVIVTP